MTTAQDYFSKLILVKLDGDGYFSTIDRDLYERICKSNKVDLAVYITSNDETTRKVAEQVLKARKIKTTTVVF